MAVRFDLSGALCKIKENSELDRKVQFGRTKPTLLLQKKSERWLIWPLSVAQGCAQSNNEVFSRFDYLLFLPNHPRNGAGYERDALMTRIPAFVDATPKKERNSQSGIIMPLRTMVMWRFYGAVVWARSARASSKARMADFRRESALRS